MDVQDMDDNALESMYTSLVPLSSHSDLESYIQRISDGDTSPLLTQQPITTLSLRVDLAEYMKAAFVVDPVMVSTSGDVLVGPSILDTFRKQGDVPPCEEGHDVQSFYQPLVPCITGTVSKRWIPIQHRSSSYLVSSSELEIHGVHHEEFLEDSEFQRLALRNYWSLLTPLIFSDHPKRPGDKDTLPPYNMIRNVLDMNAHYGGLNAAFLEARNSVWVMNVVPTGTRDTLPVILDQGYAGVYHDWCFLKLWQRLVK